MKVITKEQAVSFRDRKHVPGTSGIYVLVDPRDWTPRYVGSTQHAEYRLYSHVSDSEKGKTPKQRWLADLKASGLWPEMWMLEEFDVGPKQGRCRHEAERRWIGVCQELFGGADANTMLTPVGHTNSKDSSGKKIHAEVVALRARVAQLERELAALCGFDRCNVQHDCNVAPCCSVAQLQKLQRNAT